MGLHLAIAAFTLYLGVEGWRHAAMPFPGLAADRPPAPSEKVQRDWVVQGKLWAAATRAAGWSREPDLSLGGLAQRLGSNANYLSRALNEGLGLSFSAFINGLRSEAVAVALDAGDRRDLLEIAFDAGFASKASFNRAFRARYGMSPSVYRRRASHHENPPPLTDHEAHRENGCAMRTA
jgi:AraC-like DNA-binding protein